MNNTAIELNTLYGYALAILELKQSSNAIIKFCLSLLSRKELSNIEKRFQNELAIYNAKATLPVFSLHQRIAEAISDKDKYIELILDKVKKSIEQKYEGPKVLPKVKKLALIFGLDNNECNILTFKYLVAINDDLENSIDDLSYLSLRTSLMGHILGVQKKYLLKYLCPRGVLARHNLLIGDEINEEVNNFLMDENSPSFLNYLCTKGAKNTHPLSSFPIDSKIVSVATSIIENVKNARILIYGSPGTGKTEFAKSLVKHSEREAYFVNEPENIYFAATALNPGKEVVIADEADDILNENNPIFRTNIKKGKINIKMDTLERQCIFISNSIMGVDKSVLRRFHFIIEFKELSLSKRAAMWAKNIKPLGKIIDTKGVTTYTKKYQLSLGIASQSASIAVKCGKSKNERKEYFETIMNCHDKVVNGVLNKVKTNDKFSIDFLNTSTNIDLILNYSKVCAEKIKAGNGVRCSMLFHGSPGTGKTEFAKYVAEYLEIEPYVIKISDIKSKWVGETEQNINEAFRRAEERGEMLIFDEADSMLYSRATVHASWERDEVNEFLSMMDTYKGFLACTTNHLDTLDPACLRRFSWKVEFKTLLKQQLTKALSYYFNKVDFTGYEKEIMSLENIAAGDIAVVAGNILNEDASAREIIELLANEAVYKKQSNKDKVGF